MATIRWCPIFPKWDIYQPLWNPDRNVILKSSVIMFSCCRTQGWQYCAVKAHRLVSRLTLAPPPCLADSEESEVTHDPKSSQSLPQEIGFTRGKNKKMVCWGWFWWTWSMMIDGSDIIFGDQEILPALQWMITVWNSKSTDHVIRVSRLPGFSNMHLILTILNSMPSLSFWGWKSSDIHQRSGFFSGFSENQLPQDPEIRWLIPSFRIESCLKWGK